jgi:Domain of unknown function (DUF4936)
LGEDARLMQSLYIYYKVQPGQAPELLNAIVSMQQQLRAHMPGLAASVHQRANEPIVEMGAALHTWMEIYQFNGHADARAWAALDAALAARLPSLPAGIDGPRHAECFQTLSGAAHQPAPLHPLNPLNLVHRP